MVRLDSVWLTYWSLWWWNWIHLWHVGSAYHWLLAFYFTHDRANNLLYTLCVVLHEIWNWAWLHWDKLLWLYLFTSDDLAQFFVEWSAPFYFRRYDFHFDQALFLPSLLWPHSLGLNRLNMPLSNNLRQASGKTERVPARTEGRRYRLRCGRELAEGEGPHEQEEEE